MSFRLKMLIMAGVVGINALHPLLHAFESGSLDVILTHVNVFAARFAIE